MANNEQSFEGGLESLKPIEEAIDAHEAVGLWWANAILSCKFDSSEPTDETGVLMDRIASRDALQNRQNIVGRIGGFYKALAHISREFNLYKISVDYEPHQALEEAANMSGLPRSCDFLFPWKSHTRIGYEDGIVVAKLGYNGESEQIWLPIDPA